MMMRGVLSVVAILLSFGSPSWASEPGGLRFELRFAENTRATPFSGRVILFLSHYPRPKPRESFGWMSREPVFSMDVRNWRPGETLLFEPTRGYPFPFDRLPAGTYHIQAVMHVNPDLPHSGDAPGNLYSKAIERALDPAKDGSIELLLDRKADPARDSFNSESMKTIELRSGLLSAFHHRDIFMRAVVVLPTAFTDEPSRRFPALYAVPGFGGDESQAASYALHVGMSPTPFIRIGLDGMCGTGHHVYADSDVNGPWGRALVEELIPHLEKQFRLVAEPGARFVVGHSSGGWSALWLQVAYPDYFGGTWAIAPDPVSFEDFSGVNLYELGSNLFINSEGKDRPIMHDHGAVVLTMRDFARMEDVLGPGGQLYSFEAVFGPRRNDGSPRPLFDRTTGEVDPETVKSWQRYDICRKITREWEVLGIKLQGKVRVLMGGEDNFYLDGATRRLKKLLFKLGSDARVTIAENHDHGSIMMTDEFDRIIDEMSDQFLNWLRDHPAATQPATGAISPPDNGRRGAAQRPASSQPAVARPPIAQRPPASRPATSRPTDSRRGASRPATSGLAASARVDSRASRVGGRR